MYTRSMDAWQIDLNHRDEKITTKMVRHLYHEEVLILLNKAQNTEEIQSMKQKKSVTSSLSALDESTHRGGCSKLTILQVTKVWHVLAVHSQLFGFLNGTFQTAWDTMTLQWS